MRKIKNMFKRTAVIVIASMMIIGSSIPVFAAAKKIESLETINSMSTQDLRDTLKSYATYATASDKSSSDFAIDNTEAKTIGKALLEKIATLDNSMAIFDNMVDSGVIIKGTGDTDVDSYNVTDANGTAGVYKVKSITQTGVAKISTYLLSRLGDSGFNFTANENISAVIDADMGSFLSTRADVSTASRMLSGLSGVISTLTGLIVVVLSLGMTLYSGFDLAYIAFPVFRNNMETAKQSGHGPMVKTTSGGGTKLRFVSDDAQYAIQAVEAANDGSNPFVLYFKKRFVSYIVLAVIIFILLTGRMTIFTNLAYRIVKGFIDIISGL